MPTSDIVCYGGGMGAFASAKAYRALGGTGTIKIIEPLGAVGSMHLNGIVLTDFGSKDVNWGYWRSFNLRVADHYGGPNADIFYAWRFQPPVMKRAFQAEFAALLADPDVEIILNAPIAGQREDADELAAE